MNSREPWRLDMSEGSRNACPPVTSLGDPSLVTEALHQGCPRLGDSRDVPAFLRGFVREAKSRESRNDDMECVILSATVRGRIG